MFRILLALFLTTIWSPAQTVRIVLSGNSTISGDLIKSSSKEVFVDVGYDILKIPKSEITSIDKEINKNTKEDVQFRNILRSIW